HTRFSRDWSSDVCSSDLLDLYQHDEPYYPSSDNEPMGENDVICWLMASALDMLKRYFKDDENVYVSSNSFVYYVKGDPTQRVARSEERRVGKECRCRVEP